MSEEYNQAFIEVNHITKNYKDPASEVYFQALRGIDIKLDQGTLSAIIGPSGAGKSTLLNILGGMTRPSTGTIFVDGLPLHALDERQMDYYRRNIIGFLWQLPERNLLPHLSAMENILYAMEVSNYSREQRHHRASELLQSVGLINRKDHRLGQLSGGEAQRIGLAVALANNPKLLLADEPTGELDSETTIEIIRYMQQINQENGTTILVVTHDSRFERMTNRSYNIVDGVISGMRRSLKNIETTDWTSSVREEVSVVNQFGMVKIPPTLRDKYNLKKYIRFVEDEVNGRVYVESADKETEVN